jgi:hypothetical protein
MIDCSLLLQWLPWERTGVGPAGGSADGLGIDTEDLFLGSIRICPTLLGQCERLLRTCHVYQISPVGCTLIRIAMTHKTLYCCSSGCKQKVINLD